MSGSSLESQYAFGRTEQRGRHSLRTSRWLPDNVAGSHTSSNFHDRSERPGAPVFPEKPGSRSFLLAIASPLHARIASCVFFFLPFVLIQVHGYSATGAGAAFLPFTLILGVLSRWSGGLLNRLGARMPLIAGPAAGPAMSGSR